VHLLVNYPPKVRLSGLVNSLKGVSSRRMKHEFPAISTFWSIKKSHGALWSASYFAGSVRGAPISILRQYIEAEPASGRCALNPQPKGRGTSLALIGTRSILLLIYLKLQVETRQRESEILRQLCCLAGCDLCPTAASFPSGPPLSTSGLGFLRDLLTADRRREVWCGTVLPICSTLTAKPARNDAFNASGVSDNGRKRSTAASMATHALRPAERQSVLIRTMNCSRERPGGGNKG
jgi:hypothetical protein